MTPRQRGKGKPKRWSPWSFIMHHIPPHDDDRQHVTCGCGWVDLLPADFEAVLRARRRHDRSAEHRAWRKASR